MHMCIGEKLRNNDSVRNHQGLSLVQVNDWILWLCCSVNEAFTEVFHMWEIDFCQFRHILNKQLNRPEKETGELNSRVLSVLKYGRSSGADLGQSVTCTVETVQRCVPWSAPAGSGD